MVVQFPEAYAQYEYQHESKRFTKVVSPRDAAGGGAPQAKLQSMFRHVVPQQVDQPPNRLNNETDEEMDEDVLTRIPLSSEDCGSS